jgi:hypothetical protein
MNASFCSFGCRFRSTPKNDIDQTGTVGPVDAKGGPTTAIQLICPRVGQCTGKTAFVRAAGILEVSLPTTRQPRGLRDASGLSHRILTEADRGGGGGGVARRNDMTGS